MKLLWVSRAMHDEMIAILRVQIADERENVAMLRRQYADLQGKYHQLRLSGASDIPYERSEIATAEPDPVLLAVTARAQGDPRKRAMMLAQVRRDRADHKSDIEILQAIEDGVTVDGMPS